MALIGRVQQTASSTLEWSAAGIYSFWPQHYSLPSLHLHFHPRLRSAPHLREGLRYPPFGRHACNSRHRSVTTIKNPHPFNPVHSVGIRQQRWKTELWSMGVERWYLRELHA